MSDLTLRNVKGTPLTNQEVDDNFSNLNADKYQAGDSPTFGDITADSINITGGGNSSNWNTAYGWGNHASAGYQPANTALTTSTNFAGDVSGVYNNIVVSDNSHNHLWANITDKPTTFPPSTHNHDSDYVNVTGDSMSGDLVINKAVAAIKMGYNGGPHGIQFYDDDSTLKWGFYYRTSPDTITFELNGSSAKFTLDTSGNLTLAGTLSASGYNKTNWDTAYGWGDHAAEGYYVEGTTLNFGNSTFSTSGDNNHVHFYSPAALIPHSQTTSNNASLGTSSYRWDGIYSSTGNFDDVLTVKPDVSGTTAEDYQKIADFGPLDFYSHIYSGTAFSKFTHGSWTGYYYFSSGSSSGEKFNIRIQSSGSAQANNKIEINDGTAWRRVYHEGDFALGDYLHRSGGTLTGNVTINNSTSLYFDDAGTGTPSRLWRAGGNATRFEYYDNVFIFDAKDNANFEIRDSSDVIKFSHSPSDGNTRSYGRIFANNGTATSPAYSFNDDGNTGIYCDGNDGLYFTTAGGAKAYVNSSGLNSLSNVYIANGGSFRNYAGVWAASTGLTGNGFTFVNSIDGTAMTITSTGTVQAIADFRAPIFYDSNNTAFYVNQASTSKLRSLHLGASGQIMASSAALQVNGFMRTGNIIVHDGGNTPNTAEQTVLSATGGELYRTSSTGGNTYKFYDTGNFNPSNYLLISNYVDDYVNAASFNTGTGVLTLTRAEGGTVTVDLDGRYLTSETDSQTLSWNGNTGQLSISNGNTVDLDGRYHTPDATQGNIFASPPNGTSYYAKVASWEHYNSYSHFMGDFVIAGRYGISKFNVETSVSTPATSGFAAVIRQNNIANDRLGETGDIRVLSDSSGSTTLVELWVKVDGWSGNNYAILEDYHFHASVGNFVWSGDDAATSATAPTGVTNTHQNNFEFSTNASSRAPIFYDRDNTGFYINPASHSRVYRIEFNDADTRIEEGNSNSLRIQTNSGWTDIGPQNTAWTHIQTDRAGFYTNRKLHVDGDIFVYGTQSQLTSSSVRAPIFYDSNNTSYYVNPAGTSNINILNVADINRDPTVTVNLTGDVTGSGSATLTNLGNATINIATSAHSDGFGDLYTFTESITLTTDWQDTSISGTDLPTGSYVVQVLVYDNDAGGSQYNEWYTGYMSWFGGGTNDTAAQEIPLHNAGHADNDRAIFLRTKRNPNPGFVVLQIAGRTNNTAADNYVIKFRRMI